MSRRALAGLDHARLRLALALFFLALALPSGFLVHQAYRQLKWEAFHQYRTLAEELTARIDERLGHLIAEEEGRSFADYGFLIVAGDPAGGYLSPSPLAAFPVRADIPGLVGYFQVDAQGVFSTPLVPAADGLAASYGISAPELAARRALEGRIRAILSRNRLVEPKIAAERTAAEAAPPAPARRNGADSRASAPPVADPAARPAREATEDRTAGPDALRASAPAAGAGRVPPRPRDAARDGAAQPASPTHTQAPAPQSPAALGEPAAERREADAARLPRQIERPVPERPAAPSPAATAFESQAAFDRLDQADEEASGKRQAAAAALGRVEDLDLGQRFRRPLEEAKSEAADLAAPVAPRARVQRKERSLLPEPAPAPSEAEQAAQATGGAAPMLRIGIFESELDPFRLSLLESGHFVLYRKVWRDGVRSIQGALIEQGPFLQRMVEAAFRDTVLSRMSDLALAYRGAVLAAFRAHGEGGYPARAEALGGELLHRQRLSSPASDLELVFGIRRLPGGPGARVLGWTAGTLALVLCGGFLALDRLGRREIDLARQRQDFVSAVSHELKTPLTSIRMYAEMLRAGWADEDRRATYYDFICAESERLTRLIENVLALARLTRSEVRLDPKVATVAELLDGIRPKLASLTDRGGFELVVDLGDCGATAVRVDADYLTQILLNLVDNAVKFAKDAPRKEVRITAAERSGPRALEISVRDYGPGVPKDQRKKIFELFYRSGNELTREALGTGIGLALVRELTLAMGGRVDLADARPGAEFRVAFPVATAWNSGTGIPTTPEGRREPAPSIDGSTADAESAPVQVGGALGAGRAG